MKAIYTFVLIIAAIYFSIHLTAYGIDLHQQAMERQTRPPIELRR